MTVNKMRQKHIPYGPYERYFKRPLDIFLALLTIALFWWLYLIIAVLVRINLGSPIIFTQDRVGKDEKIFRIYKFRTMTDARDKNGKLLPDAERMTKLGKVLRSTSLDEIPQAFNILEGTCSWIGPRPLLVSYLDKFDDIQRHRHDVRPGLIGFTKMGRHATSWEKQFEWDVWYAGHITLLEDIKIIFRAIPNVLSGFITISSPDREAFTGSAHTGQTKESGEAGSGKDDNTAGRAKKNNEKEKELYAAAQGEQR